MQRELSICGTTNKYTPVLDLGIYLHFVMLRCTFGLAILGQRMNKYYRKKLILKKKVLSNVVFQKAHRDEHDG